MLTRVILRTVQCLYMQYYSVLEFEESQGGQRLHVALHYRAQEAYALGDAPVLGGARIDSSRPSRRETTGSARPKNRNFQIFPKCYPGILL
jgi:hypothetical protein